MHLFGILFPRALVLSLYGWLVPSVIALDLSRLPMTTTRPGCTKEIIDACTAINAICVEPGDYCVCKVGLQFIGGTCKERLCTEEKQGQCRSKGATCREPEGDCVCNPGLEMVNGTCKGCTKEKIDACRRIGATCEEPGEYCSSKSEPPGCTKDKIDACTAINATCVEPGEYCVCKPGLQWIDGTCKDQACTEEKREYCQGKFATCQEPKGDCICNPGLQMINGTCRGCTKEKIDACARIGAICKEPGEYCACETGIAWVNGTCKACTEERENECTRIDATCQEPEGSCVCKAGLQMINGACKEMQACTKEVIAACAALNATCVEPGEYCVCHPGLQWINGKCKEKACTDEKQEECRRKWAICQEPEGDCVCNPGLQMINGTCIDEPGCTKERLVECTRIGAACMQPKGECVCISWKQMINGSCQYVSTAATEISPWSSEFTRKDRAPDVFRTTSAPKEEATTATETREWTSDTTPRDTTPRVTIGTTISTQGTGKCDDKVCKRPRCVCASNAPPAGLRVDEMPQFVMLTFDDAVTVLNMAFYRELLNISRRKNKQNGCSIAATFFVSGEYLDYEAVNQLHSWGNEIALHSISHRTDSSYWQTINSTQWEREVLDQRAMLTAFANVPASDVTGFRGPFLFTGGDQGFGMLHKYFRYDSTLVHQRVRGELPVYPYTMDFGFRRTCNVWPCPQGTYTGLWVLPMNVFFPKRTEGDRPCAMADACLPLPVTANGTFEYLKSNFEEFYNTNRAPFPVFLHEAYLRHPQRKAGYLKFVDWLLEKDDVYLVTASEVLRFMEDPKPLSAYAKRTCSRRNVHGRSTCPRPTTCSYKNTPAGGERYMRTCSVCPKNYPWVNNPLGN